VAKVSAQVGGHVSDAVYGLAIQATDGKIVAVGGRGPGIADVSALARYNPDGSLDATFGSGGLVYPTFGQGDTAVALQADGKIVVTAGNNGNFGLARYLPSEPAIGSFTSSSSSVSAGSSVTLTASSISDGNPQASISQVTFYLDSNNDGTLETSGSNADTLLGYGTLSSTGGWTFTWSTTGLTAGTYKLFAQAKDNYGVYGDPASLTVTLT
jgi:hypothetical protein